MSNALIVVLYIVNVHDRILNLLNSLLRPGLDHEISPFKGLEHRKAA